MRSASFSYSLPLSTALVLHILVAGHKLPCNLLAQSSWLEIWVAPKRSPRSLYLFDSRDLFLKTRVFFSFSLSLPLIQLFHACTNYLETCDIWWHFSRASVVHYNENICTGTDVYMCVFEVVHMPRIQDSNGIEISGVDAVCWIYYIFLHTKSRLLNLRMAL